MNLIKLKLIKDPNIFFNFEIFVLNKMISLRRIPLLRSLKSFKPLTFIPSFHCSNQSEERDWKPEDFENFRTFSKEELKRLGQEKQKSLEILFEHPAVHMEDMIISSVVSLPLAIASASIWLLPEAHIANAITFTIKYMGMKICLFAGMNFGYSIVNHQIAMFSVDQEEQFSTTSVYLRNISHNKN